QLDFEAGGVASPLERAIHALEVVRQPAAVVFRRDDLELRKPIEHPGEDEDAERALDLVREDSGPHVAIAEIPLALPSHPRDGVQADGHPHLLGSRPECIIDGRTVGLIRGRRAPDHGALEATLCAALELLSSRLRVVQTDHRQAGHPLGSVTAIRRQPVVVDAEAVLLQPGILEPEQPEAESRVEHVRLYAIELVVLQPLARIPPSWTRVGIRASREELGELLRALARPKPDPDRMERVALVVEVRAVRIGRVRHETRRALTILLLHALDPQVR